MTTENTPAPSTDEAAAVEGASADILAAPLAATPALDGSNPIHFEMLDRLAQLEAALLARDPMMKVHLGAIHKSLIQHEELTHLLSIDQIKAIVGAQQVHTNTSLVSELTSKAGKAKTASRLKNISVSDL